MPPLPSHSLARSRYAVPLIIMLSQIALLLGVWLSLERNDSEKMERNNLPIRFFSGNTRVDWQKRYGLRLSVDREIHNNFSSDCQPTQLHLSPATDVDLETHRVNMTLSFALDLSRCHGLRPHIFYGTSESSLHEVQADSIENLRFSFTSHVRTFHSSSIYHAVLEGLEADSKEYWYQIRMESNASRDIDIEKLNLIRSSDFHRFQTPPLQSKPVRIAMIADWGGAADSVKTMEAILARTNHSHSGGDLDAPISAVIVAGDLSYANGYLPAWEGWLTKMEPLFRSTPLLVAAGNHEIECDRKTFEIFKPYESYFRTPNRLGAAQIEPASQHGFLDCTHPSQYVAEYIYGNSFYAYQHGMLQIVVLNAYTNTTKGSVQYNWFQQEMDTIDRSITPWVLVVFHCPLHTTFRGHNNELNTHLMMDHLEPLFVQYGVNLVLSGHNHAYVRTHPLKGNNVVKEGPVYLTIGSGGASHAKPPLHDTPEDWVAHRDNTEYGFGELHALNATHAFFSRRLHAGKPIEADDQVWLENYGLSVAANEPKQQDPPPPSQGSYSYS